jgi:hypothetical protein
MRCDWHMQLAGGRIERKSSSASSTIGTDVHERVRHLSVPRGVRLEFSVSVELVDDIMNGS